MADTPAPDAAPTPARRFLDRGNSSPTLISAGTRLEGTVNCAADLAVAGEVIGPGQIHGMLTLAEKGNWQGEVQCGQALLAGNFSGQLTVNGKLEIRSGAHIQGRISAQHIAIAEGAMVEAELSVLSGAEIQRFAEKRGR
ncbi:MAG: polymer-forming cytoskeletal protein [Steroidobacteraceae bacterium]